MKVLRKAKELKFQDIQDLEGWIGDAKFGVNQLSQYFKKKKLEVLDRMWYKSFIGLIKRKIS